MPFYSTAIPKTITDNSKNLAVESLSKVLKPPLCTIRISIYSAAPQLHSSTPHTPSLLHNTRSPTEQQHHTFISPASRIHARPNVVKPTNIATAKCHAQLLFTNPNYSCSTKSAPLFLTTKTSLALMKKLWH